MLTHSIWDLVAWLLGATALWLIASIPGYWLFSGWVPLREALGGAFRSFVTLTASVRSRRRAAEAASRAGIDDRLRQRDVEGAAAAEWDHTLGTMLEGVRAGSTQVRKTRAAALADTRKLERVAQRVRNLKLLSADIPVIPAMDDLLLQARRNRVAVIDLVACIVLLTPICLANALFTGLVLGEGLPPVQPIMGVPVAYGLAVILVIVEIAIGVVHSSAAEAREGSERRLTMAMLLWSVFAVAIVAMETFLYAQVQPSSIALRLPVGGSAFALIGFVLGGAVFGLGALAHRSLATMRKDRTPKAVAKQLRGLTAAADEWNLVAARLKPAQAECVETFDKLVVLCREVSVTQAGAIEQLANQLNAMRETPPAWARRPAGRSRFSAALRQIGRLVSFLKLPVMWIVHRLAGGLLWIGVALFWIVQVAACVIEHAARIIAWPTIVVLGAIRSKRQAHAGIAVVQA